jgi:hypothetical protein
MTTRIESTSPDLGALQQRFKALREAAFETQLEAAHWWPCPNPMHPSEGPCYWVDEVAVDAPAGAPFNAGQGVLVAEVCPRRFEAVGVALAGPTPIGRTNERNAP